MAAFTPIGVEAVVKNLNGFNRDLGKMNSSIGSAGTAATEASGKFGGFSSALSSVASVAAGAVVAGIGAATAATIGLATAGVKAAISYESAFAGVLKTTDGLTDSLGNLNATGEELRQGFIQLSKEIPVSPDALANIGELGGQLGIARDDLLDFTRIIAEVGETTDISIEDAALSFAQFANIMGSSQDDMDRFSSALVELGNNSATTESAILGLAARISGAGAVVGLTEDQVLGIAAAFASVGVDAEAGGTAVSKVLQNINTSVLTADDNLEVFAATAGLSSEKFAELWETDASRAFDLFVQGLGNAGDDAIAILDELELRDVRLVSAFLRVANAGDIVSESLETSARGFKENNARSEEAAKRFATTESQLQLLKNAFNANKIAIGDALLPAVRLVVGELINLADSGSFLLPFFEKIGAFLSANLPAAIQATLGFMESLSEFMAVALPQAIAIASEIFNNVLVPAFQTAIAIGGPILKALVELAGNLLPVAVEGGAQAFNSVLLPALQAIGGFLQNVVVPAFTIVQAAVLGFIELVQANIPTIQAVFLTAFEVIKAVVLAVGQTLSDNVGPAIQAAIQTLSDTVGSFGITWSDVWNAVSQAIQIVGSVIGAAILGIIGVVTGLVTAVASGVEAASVAIADLTAAFQSGLQAIESILISWSELVGAILKGDIQGIIDASIGIWNGFMDFFHSLFDGMIALFDLSFGTLAATVDGFITGATEFFENFARNLGADIVPGMWSRIQESFESGVRDALEAISSFSSDVLDFFVDLVKKVAETFEDFDWNEVGAAILQGIADGVKNNAAALNDTIRALAQRAWDSAKDALGISSPSKVFMGAGIEIVNGIIAGIGGQIPPLLDTVTDTMDAIVETADKIIRDVPSRVSNDAFIEIGQNMAAGIVAGFKAEAETTIEAVKDTLGAAGTLSNLFAKQFEASVVTPLGEAVEVRGAFLQSLKDDLSDVFGGVDLTEQDIRALIEATTLMRATGQPSAGFTQEQLSALQRVVDIQAEVAGLTAQEAAAQQELLNIEKQRAQLGFLQDQLKLLELIREAGLDPQEILGGLELGLEADVSGLLAATQAATQALIDQAESDLGIGSPSKVFMEIGRNVMAGLTAGVQSAMQFPRQAVAQATQMMTPQASSVTNNTQNVSITANISNGMDLAGFQAAANRALGNGVLI